MNSLTPSRSSASDTVSRPLTSAHRIMTLAAVLALTLATGCLKTRATLRGEDGDAAENEPSQPVRAQAPQPVQPQGGYVIDEIKLEITRLNGRIEQLERAAADHSKSNLGPEFATKIESKLAELEQAQSALAESLKALTATRALSPSAGDAADSDAEPQDGLTRARAEIQSKDFEAAADTLALYLKNPKAKYADEATYLRGEALVELKQHKKAILELSKFTDKYAKSKRAPAALLKMGQSFEALGMRDDAKGFYQELTEKYPKSPEAKKAKAKLK